MAQALVSVTNTNSILDELMSRQEAIAQRAYGLFCGHADRFAADLDDWLQAERELFPEPAIELRKADGHFDIEAALPGVDPKKVDVKVTAEDVLITAVREEREERKEEPETAAAAGRAPGGTRRYFRAIHLPEPIDPGQVKADYRQGLLHLTAPIVKAEARTIEVRT
jgi:HSP20 family protein